MREYLSLILENTGNLTTQDIFLRIAVSVLFGGVIYLSYRLTHTGSVYSDKFNITLVTLTVLTTTVMTVIGNNVALSLGMVGALSIIRFRTSVKDSRDSAYIFWTIIVGICCGVGDFAVAAAGSAAVFIVLILFGKVKNEHRILLIIRCDRVQEDSVRRLLFEYFTSPPVLKAENTTQEKAEFIYEINRKMLEKAEAKARAEATAAKQEPLSLTQRIYALGGMDYVNIVLQSDEIT